MVPQDRSTDRPSARASRRWLLAAGGTGLATTLAGCSGLRTRTLSRPDEEADDTWNVLRYYDDDGERLAIVSFQNRWNLSGGRLPYEFRLHIWHADDVVLERLRYEFRPPDASHQPALSLTRPAGYPRTSIEFGRGDEYETTVLEVPDLGSMGRGSVEFTFLVDPHTDESFDLEVDVEATLGPDGAFGLGRTYELGGDFVRTLPGYDDFD